MEAVLTVKQMKRRADQIIRAIQAGHVSPDSELIAELAEIVDVLSDQPGFCGGAVKLAPLAKQHLPIFDTTRIVRPS